MKMKVLIGFLLLFLVIGVASAGTINYDFKAPTDFKEMGEGNFMDENQHNIQIMDDNEDFHATWFKNASDFTVAPYEGNDSVYVYTTAENDNGLVEIVECDGEKYIVNFWTTKGADDVKEVENILSDFNKVNGLTPVTIEG